MIKICGEAEGEIYMAGMGNGGFIDGRGKQWSAWADV